MSLRGTAVLLLLLALAGALIWAPWDVTAPVTPTLDVNEAPEEDTRATLAGEFDGDGDVVPTRAPVYAKPKPTSERRWGIRCEVRAQRDALEPAKPWSNCPISLRLGTKDDTRFATVQGKTDDHGRFAFGPFSENVWTDELIAERVTEFLVRAEHPKGGAAQSWIGTPAYVLRRIGELASLGSSTASPDGVIWIPCTLRRLHIPIRQLRTVTRDGVALSGLGTRAQPTIFRDSDPRLGSVHALPPGRTKMELVIDGSFTLNHPVVLPTEAPTGKIVDVIVDDASIIEGRVTGPGDKPLEGIHVVLAASKDSPNNSMYTTLPNGQRIMRMPARGRPAPHRASHLSAMTDKQGRFAFAGLREKLDYYLFWGDATDHWHVEERPARRGDSAVELRVVQHGFRVEVRDADTGTTLPDAWVAAERLTTQAEVGYPEATLKPVSAFTLGQPGQRFHVSASHPGYASKTQNVDVANGAPTTVTLELEKLGEAPSLRVAFQDDAGAPLQAVSLSVYQRRPGKQRLGEWYAPDARPLRDGNTITLTPIAAGLARLQAIPLVPDGVPEHEALHIPAKQQIDISPTGTTEATLTLQRGGRLQTTIKLPTREPAKSPHDYIRALLLDAKGEPVDPGWHEQNANGTWSRLWDAAGLLVTDGQLLASKSLRPGTYTLIVSSQHPQHKHGVVAEQIIEIKVGKVLDLKVDLDKARPAPAPPKNQQGSCGACGAASCG